MDKELYDQIYQIENLHWWYTTRQRIIFDWINKLLTDYDDPWVLDIGCGSGLVIEKLSTSGLNNVIGLDISSNALDYCHLRNLSKLVCGDAKYIPLSDESFDLILALDLLEHIDNDVQVINEISRLLKSNGTLVLTTPAFRFLWGLQDIVSHHQRRYEINDLGKKLIGAGLHPSKLSYMNMFLFPFILVGRLILRIIGYHRLGLISENDFTPDWSNRLLSIIFSAELPLLRRINFPFGVSILGIFVK